MVEKSSRPAEFLVSTVYLCLFINLDNVNFQSLDGLNRKDTMLFWTSLYVTVSFQIPEIAYTFFLALDLKWGDSMSKASLENSALASILSWCFCAIMKNFLPLEKTTLHPWIVFYAIKNIPLGRYDMKLATYILGFECFFIA